MSDTGPDSAIFKNMMAVKAHSEETRKMVRQMESQLNSIGNLMAKIEVLEKQVQMLQVKTFNGGATG